HMIQALRRPSVVQDVTAAAADQHIVARATVENVVIDCRARGTRRLSQDGAPYAARSVRVSCKGIVAVAQERVVTQSTQQRVFSNAALQAVAARSAFEPVVAGSAPHRVILRTAEQGVIAAVPFEP